MNIQLSKTILGVGALSVAISGILAAPGNAEAQDKRSYILATATTGGTYYPVGVGLSTVIRVKLEPKHKISMAAITSAGSGENVKLIRTKEAQFAILQGLFGAWAWNGTGKVKQSGKQAHLRSVTMLWQNVEHFIVPAKDAKTGTVSDLTNLKGRPFSIGKKNSGTEGSGTHTLNGLGINPEKTFDLVHLGYGPTAEAMLNGKVDGANIPAGDPVGAITRLYAGASGKFRILDFTDKQMEDANQGMKLWTRQVIPANTYPGQSKAVNTIAQPNFLATHKDIPEQDVYMIVKTIYDNLDMLNGIHKATTAMSLKKAIAGLPAPLHPGAAKFYREKGLKIPAHLIAK